MTTRAIQFLLNNELISLSEIDPNTTVLQYLREVQFKTGTKEGCASGDCGACTVVLAELAPNNELAYKAINACITFIGTLHGKQLITVEHLKDASKLHHVQQSLVDHHGTQCGFCTPGFVMSAFALHKHNKQPNREDVIEALAGNLCRCTGYRSIIDAALDNKPSEDDSFNKHYRQTIDKLNKIALAPTPRLTERNNHFVAPNNIDDLAYELKQKPNATLIAGGTDLALSVTQNLTSFTDLIYLGNVKQLNQVIETDNEIIIGAAVPYSKFTQLLCKYYPDLGEMIERIGAKQVRNNGTLGGNIGNASPIGDMPPALISLGAKLTLNKNGQERLVLVEDYFIDYKKTILQAEEFIKTIHIPKPEKNQILKIYKISKRIDDDISAVLAAFSLTLENNEISQIRIAFGGMAAIPKRGKMSEQALKNKTFNQKHIDNAKYALTLDFTPMTDVRATDKYRMKVAQNLIEKCYLELTTRNIETRVVNYA